MNPTTPMGRLNTHDTKVIAFHVAVAMLQAGLMTLGAYHFGKYDSEVALAIQVIAELLRRLVV